VKTSSHIEGRCRRRGEEFEILTNIVAYIIRILGSKTISGGIDPLILGLLENVLSTHKLKEYLNNAVKISTADQ
jgi:hypothetical protein